MQWDPSIVGNEFPLRIGLVRVVNLDEDVALTFRLQGKEGPDIEQLPSHLSTGPVVQICATCAEGEIIGS